MTIGYVNQCQNSSLSGVGTLTATSSLTLSAGDTVEIQLLGTLNAIFSAVGDGLGNTYTAVGSTPLTADSLTVYTYVAQNCAAGTATPTASTSTGSMQAIYGKQITGAATTGAVVGYNGFFQSSPGTGANILVSGNVAVGATPINVLVSGFGFNFNGGTPLITAGTTLAFTGRAAVWSVYGNGTALTLPEDIRIAGATGNVQATFGVSTGSAPFDDFATVIVVYAEGGPLDTIPCGTTASGTTVATGTGGLALPAFNVGDCIHVLIMAQTASALTNGVPSDGANTYVHLEQADNHATTGFIFDNWMTMVTTPLANPVITSICSGTAKLAIAAGKVPNISPGSPNVPGGNAQHTQTAPSGTNAQISGLTTSANTNVPVTLSAWGFSDNLTGAPTAGTGFAQIGTAWSALGAPCLTFETQTSSSLIQQQAFFTPIGGSDTYTFLCVFNQVSVAFQVIMGQACL